MNILWLQSGGCSGCSISLLNLESDDLLSWSESLGLNWLYHPSFSQGGALETHKLIESIGTGETPLDILCIEGSVIMGPDNTGQYLRLSGSSEPLKSVIENLAEKARYVIAVGTCAAYGGITAAKPNLMDATGMQFMQSNPFGGLFDASFVSQSGLPVINISGCPVHPEWVTGTLSLIKHGRLDQASLDALNRPKFYASKLVHHGCSRNEYYEYKASAVKPSDKGCMMENMGCVGTVAHADCNQRGWNGGGSCTEAGYACVDCTSPVFGHEEHSYQKTPKIGGIPVGLPTDMPKAWFVALSSLSKAATPERLKTNATQYYEKIEPEIKRLK